MSFTLTMSNVIVGRSELEHRDPERRLATGAFRPGLGYELAQPVFELYDAASGDAAALARYRQARDALRLTLAGPSGASVAIRELRVRRADTGAASRPALVLEIETDDPAFWASTPPVTR
jgi:hypothetical protein